LTSQSALMKSGISDSSFNTNGPIMRRRSTRAICGSVRSVFFQSSARCRSATRSSSSRGCCGGGAFRRTSSRAISCSRLRMPGAMVSAGTPAAIDLIRFCTSPRRRSRSASSLERSSPLCCSTMLRSSSMNFVPSSVPSTIVSTTSSTYSIGSTRSFLQVPGFRRLVEQT